MKINTYKIEILLGKQDMTKTALGEKAGICRQNISTILKRGTCEPRTVAKLASGLGVDINEIIEN